MFVPVVVTATTFLVFSAVCEDNQNDWKSIEINERSPKILGLLAILEGGSRMSPQVQLTSGYNLLHKKASLNFQVKGEEEESEEKHEQKIYTIFFPIYQNFGIVNSFQGRSLSSENPQNIRNFWNDRRKRSVQPGRSLRRQRRNADSETSEGNDDDNYSTTAEDIKAVDDSMETPTTTTASVILPTTVAMGDGKLNTSYGPPPSGNPWKPDYSWSSYYPSSTGCFCPPTSCGPSYSNFYRPPATPNEVYSYGPPVFDDFHYISHSKPPLPYYQYNGYHGHPSFKPSFPDYYMDNWDAQKQTFYPVAHKK